MKLNTSGSKFPVFQPSSSDKAVGVSITLPEIYADIQKENHDFKLDADAVMSWAYRLMADGHLPEAMDVVKLAVQIDPSSRAYSGLAEAYMKSGQEKEAIESYERALEKDSGNILAKQRLQELKK